MKTITVVTDVEGDEAIYVDGKCKVISDPIYAIDVAEIANEEPIILRHVMSEKLPGSDWPVKLEDLSKMEGM